METAPDELVFSRGDDTEILFDCAGLEFYSIGDWPSGYDSFFEHEKEMVGLEELIDPYREEIMEAINASFAKMSKVTPQHVFPSNASITTLWSSYSYQDYEGEWDSSIEYHGVFELKDIRKLIV